MRPVKSSLLKQPATCASPTTGASERGIASRPRQQVVLIRCNFLPVGERWFDDGLWVPERGAASLQGLNHTVISPVNSWSADRRNNNNKPGELHTGMRPRGPVLMRREQSQELTVQNWVLIEKGQLCCHHLCPSYPSKVKQPHCVRVCAHFHYPALFRNKQTPNYHC